MSKRSDIRVGKDRPVFERLMMIYAWLRFPSGQRITARIIAERLEISEKTAQRDIDFLRDRIGMPVYYDGAEFTWKTDPSVKLPWVIRDNEADKR